MTDPHGAQARIGSASDHGQTIGCGLLVTPRHVITCAHVAAQGLGTEATDPQAPAGNLPVDLPLLEHPFRTIGRVVHWVPVREATNKDPEDIAVLELDQEAPPEAEPARLISKEPNEYTGLEVHCFGFPAGIHEGVRRHGTCRGENARGWVQLDVARGSVAGGFSGTGAWTRTPDGAVGLVVAARVAERYAALIPTRTLFVACPELDTSWRPRNPYKSLNAFGPEDHADFP